jgi:hypothetical protein
LLQIIQIRFIRGFMNDSSLKATSLVSLGVGLTGYLGGQFGTALGMNVSPVGMGLSCALLVAIPGMTWVLSSGTRHQVSITELSFFLSFPAGGLLTSALGFNTTILTPAGGLILGAASVALTAALVALVGAATLSCFGISFKIWN